MATASSAGRVSGGSGRRGSSSREGSAKAMLTDQISQAVQSTSNLLHLMQESSPSQKVAGNQLRNYLERLRNVREREEQRNLKHQDRTREFRLWKNVQLAKLPKDLLAKTSTIKNTQLVLEQMPWVISSLDAHMDSGLQSVPHLKTVTQLLENIESSQLKSLGKVQLSPEESQLEDKLPEAG